MSLQKRLLTPGTLWPALCERTEQARRCGAIQSIPTATETIEQGGVLFIIRVVAALAKKAEAATIHSPSAHSQAAQPPVNPFLPYDPDLFVADLSPTHVALLNKFNVVDHHLVIVTRSFEEQELLLTEQDCLALLACLAEIDGLGFYNAGPVAGASQRHKHLQLVPLPLSSTGPRFPIEPLLHRTQVTGQTGIIPGLPFLHAHAPMDQRWLDSPVEAAPLLLARYETLLHRAQVPISRTPEGLRTGPYNLLVTRQWMLLIPRSAECFEGISINALGFGGGLLVKDEAQLKILKTRGPMTALRQVGFPRQT
jgi:ATP adenylyltransferase